MLSNLDIVRLTIATIALYLLIGFVLGDYFVRKLGYEKMESRAEILKDFVKKWPYIVYSGIALYLKKCKERQAIINSFKPLDIYICLAK